MKLKEDPLLELRMQKNHLNTISKPYLPFVVFERMKNVLIDS